MNNNINNFIKTPDGLGQFIDFDGAKGTVTVKVMGLVKTYPGDQCFVIREQKKLWASP